MGGVSVWQLLILLVLSFIWVVPWVFVLISKKAKGMHKIIWFVLSFFISWIGYFVYYFVVIKELPENNA